MHSRTNIALFAGGIQRERDIFLLFRGDIGLNRPGCKYSRCTRQRLWEILHKQVRFCGHLEHFYTHMLHRGCTCINFVSVVEHLCDASKVVGGGSAQPGALLWSQPASLKHKGRVLFAETYYEWQRSDLCTADLFAGRIWAIYDNYTLFVTYPKGDLRPRWACCYVLFCSYFSNCKALNIWWVTHA